jgi:hypothetical protein
LRGKAPPPGFWERMKNWPAGWQIAFWFACVGTVGFCFIVMPMLFVLVYVMGHF